MALVEKKHILLNDRMITDEHVDIQVNDRGFLLGDGLFETLKAQNGQIEFFDAHYERLKKSAIILMIPFLYQKDALKSACDNLVKKNKLHRECASVRITLTRGIGTRGIDLPNSPAPTLLMTATAYQPPAANDHVRATITSIQRNPTSLITKLKTLNYLEPILARAEAKKRGFDEGVMTNTHGHITECSVANIFFIKDEQIITPAIQSGVLPGIMRNHVIRLCRENGYSVTERTVFVDDALTADEAFQTNALIGIQGIAQIDKKQYATVTVKKIQQLLIPLACRQ